jgi:hypothetical protein
VRDSRLNRPYGGKALPAIINKLRLYKVNFRQTLDVNGEIRVYSPKFIQVAYDVKGRKGEPVFESEENAEKFFKLGVIEGKWEEAEKIPQKPPKEVDDEE